MKPLHILAVIIIFIVFAAISYIFFYHATDSTRRNVARVSEKENVDSPTNPLNSDPAGERKKWMRRIDKVGPERAYSEFKKENQLRDERFRHGEAHLFGEVLYEKAGIRGISICDNSFTFACYHSFFGRAISEQGLGTLPVIERACIEKFGVNPSACTHGIGHGLLAYLGPDKLLSALHACDTLQEKLVFGGCPSGVFMEYSIPLDVGATLTRLRPFDEAYPYEPCVLTPEKFRQSCYHEIGKWWEFFLDYEKIGRLCDVIVSAKEKEACFQGVGDIATLSSGYDVTETVNKCKKMPTGEGELLCRKGAFLFFSGIAEYKALAPALCQGVGADRAYICFGFDATQERNL